MLALREDAEEGEVVSDYNAEQIDRTQAEAERQLRQTGGGCVMNVIAALVALVVVVLLGVM